MLQTNYLIRKKKTQACHGSSWKCGQEVVLPLRLGHWPCVPKLRNFLNIGLSLQLLARNSWMDMSFGLNSGIVSRVGWKEFQKNILNKDGSMPKLKRTGFQGPETQHMGGKD